MLTKDDLQKMKEMIGEVIDERFDGQFLKLGGRFGTLEERFSTLEQKFDIVRDEIKSDLQQCKLDILNGYERIGRDLKIIGGYRQKFSNLFLCVHIHSEYQ